MEVVGIITGEIQRRIAPTSQAPYFSFRLVERVGPRDRKSTSWYDCYAHLPDHIMDQVRSRDLVRIRGKVEAVPFTRNDKTTDARLRLVCFHLEVVETFEAHLARRAQHESQEPSPAAEDSEA